MPELETVDLEGVEILAAGGPVHGVGSPPEGDFWTTEQLRGMAEAAVELADEVKPPAKIGHKGGDPAVGWLENVRINDDGSKLLADIRKVPKGLSSLIDAGAYRTRSVELRQHTSQKTGKNYDWVVTGLAWLGGKMPAVKTLADVVKLYESDDDPDRKFVAVEETAADVDDLRDAVADLGRELAGRNPAPPDSSPMPKPKYTDDQRRAFAETTGLEADKVTDEMLDTAAATLKIEPPAAPERNLEADERIRNLETQAKEADERSRRLETELADERKRAFVESVLRDGKAQPGQRAEIELMYDASAEVARKYFDTVQANDDLAREYGSDDDAGDSTPEAEKQRDLSEREQIARDYGLDLEEVV